MPGMSLGHRGEHACLLRTEAEYLGITQRFRPGERYYPAFRDVMAAQGKPLPLHVQQEFDDYLK